VVLTSAQHKREDSGSKFAASSSEMVKLQALGCLSEHLQLRLTDVEGNPDTFGGETRGSR